MINPKRIVSLSAIITIFSLVGTIWAGPQEDRTLFDAIRKNDSAAVQKALDQGANPNARSFGGTAEDAARKGGNAQIIALLANAVTSSDTSTAQPEPTREPVPAIERTDAPRPAPMPNQPSEPKTTSSTPVTQPTEAAETTTASTASATPPVTASQGAVQPPADEDTAALAAEIIRTGGMKQRYNPIVVDYLVNEGKNRLSPELTKAALDQLVAALLAKTQISKEEQLEMSLGVLTGIAMGAAGNDVISDAGGDVESSYASDWSDWIDSAFNLIHAGYGDDAARFFEFGMVHIPYPALRARCVKGLALAHPEQAYGFLMEKLKTDNGPDVKANALPLLGLLASDKNCTPEHQEAILQMLTDNTGMMAGPDGQLGAMRGLENMNDPRAADIMRKFTAGLTVDKNVKRAAIRGLLFTYGDKEMIPLLEKTANAGSFSMTDDYDKVWAGLLLIQAQTPEGYAWATEKLPPPKKSFFAPKDTGPDPRADIVHYLVKYGGDKGRQILADSIGKYKDDDWMKTWIATGLLEFRDTSYIALVKASLSNPEWDFTAVRMVEALAKNGDYSGLTVFDELIRKTPPIKSNATKFMNALAGKEDDTAAKARRLARLRIQIADALARINTQPCVPLLASLLADQDIYVRSAAALALTEMTIPAALDGLKVAVTADYGIANKQSRNPNIQAHVIRLASMRFPGDTRTTQIQQAGRASSDAAVRFLGSVEP